MEQEMNQKLDEILKIVTFIKDNAAMQKDVDARFERIEEDLRAIRADISEIKERLTKLEKRALEDADASAQEIIELRQRVDELERRVATLQQAHQPA
ncbi:MAG: hypothetical protein AAB579_03900 [Patescibacteria group bacterium]